MPESAPDKNLLKRAETLSEINRWEEAIVLFSRYLIQEPESYRANCFLSHCFHQIKDYKQALKYAETSIRLNPEDEWGYRLRSAVLANMKKYKESLISAREAVRLKPEGNLAVQRLMYAYRDCNKTKEAMQTGEKLRSLQPENESSYILLGSILMDKSRYKEAEELFHQALKINPASSNALAYLGTIYEKQNKGDKAVELYQKAIQASPQNEWAQEKLRSATKRPFIWFGVLLTFIGGFYQPLLFITTAFFLWEYYRKARLYHQLPRPIQMFIDSKKITAQIKSTSPADFLDSELALPLTKVLFFVIMAMSVISAVSLAISANPDPASASEAVLSVLKYWAILSIVALPFGLFWLYLARRNGKK